MSETVAEVAVNSELGEMAKFLSEKGIKINYLGKNASGVEMIELEPADLVQASKELKKSKKMNVLNFITATEVKRGYQSSAQIENLDDKTAVVLKVVVSKENPNVPTLTEVFPTADWQEREAYDMIGINYEGHPNLVRILNPDKWDGHPLRKDYIGPVDWLNQPLSLNK